MFRVSGVLSFWSPCHILSLTLAQLPSGPGMHLHAHSRLGASAERPLCLGCVSEILAHLMPSWCVTLSNFTLSNIPIQRVSPDYHVFFSSSTQIASTTMYIWLFILLPSSTMQYSPWQEELCWGREWHWPSILEKLDSNSSYFLF